MTKATAVRASGLSQHQLKWLLVVPLVAFFVLFFVIPVGLLFATSFNPAKVGQVALVSDLTFDNYIRFFSRSNYLIAAGRSILLASIVSADHLNRRLSDGFCDCQNRKPGAKHLSADPRAGVDATGHGDPTVWDDGDSWRQRADQPDSSRHGADGRPGRADV